MFGNAWPEGITKFVTSLLSFIDDLHEMQSYLFHSLWGIAPPGNPKTLKPVNKEGVRRQYPQLKIFRGPVCFSRWGLKDSWCDKGRVCSQGEGQWSCMQAEKGWPGWAPREWNYQMPSRPWNSVLWMVVVGAVLALGLGFQYECWLMFAYH